jgi:hypothetical protein
MSISNAEKQSRFRKKEELKKRAEYIFREGQLAFQNPRATPQAIRQFLDEAINLPANWTDDDYNFAHQKIEQYRLDLFSTPDPIAVDIQDSINFGVDFLTVPDPRKHIEDTKKATQNAHALADHIMSALKLSSCGPAEQAAAIMEAVRMIGRSLANSRNIPQSNATTMCLVSLEPHYARPEWFVDKLADIVRWRMSEELAHDLGQRLIEITPLGKK